MPPRRCESAYASARKRVSLVHLKLVDLLPTGTALEFKYLGRVFSASITVECYLRTPRHALHAHADRSDDAYSYYRLPSNFTNDAVSVYCAENPSPAVSRDTCRTNPSGYERVRLAGGGKSLNDLRDEFMRCYVDVTRPGSAPALADEPCAPEALAAAALASSTSSRKRRRNTEQPPPPRAAEPSAPPVGVLGAELAAVLGDGAVTIATLRAHAGLVGHKQMALALEHKLQRQRRVLLELLAYTEAVGAGATPAPANTPAAANARAIVAAALDAAAAVAAAPPPPEDGSRTSDGREEEEEEDTSASLAEVLARALSAC